VQIKVEEYVERSGQCPYREWFDRLSPSYAAKVSVALLRLEQGNTSSIKWFDGLGELRIDWGPGMIRMVLTRDFKHTMAERAERDPAFAKALLDEAATLFLNGEPELARSILRDLVNATVGFEHLSRKTMKNSKSLHRMLASGGNPTMDNLASIFSAIGESLKVELKVVAKSA